MDRFRQARFRALTTVAAALWTIALAPVLAAGGVDSMPNVAKGTFEVKLESQSETGAQDDNTNLGRMTIDKVYRGDLDAVGKGEMLTAVTRTKASAGYVAIERVTGSLQGRRGSFVLQHTGTMSGGSQDLSITVVPDSGTGELAGIVGTFDIKIADGAHSYEFEYTLPE